MSNQTNELLVLSASDRYPSTLIRVGDTVRLWYNHKAREGIVVGLGVNKGGKNYITITHPHDGVKSHTTMTQPDRGFGYLEVVNPIVKVNMLQWLELMTN